MGESFAGTVQDHVRARFGLIVGLAGLLLGVGFGLLQRQPPDTPFLPASAGTVGAPFVEVHVVGWVASPGVVSVAPGSLVLDAVMAAGGLRPGAMVEEVNLAAPVIGGQQIVVPGPDTPTSGSSGKLAINRATAAELESLPGVGPVLAGRIVAFREQHGPFREIEDLLAVPGIGEAKLASLRDHITAP